MQSTIQLIFNSRIFLCAPSSLFESLVTWKNKLLSLASGFGASITTVTSSKYFREEHTECHFNLS